MQEGTVKWFNSDKGFGFIAPNEGGKDIFVHYSGIVGSGHRSLTEGQQVEYSTEQGKRGPQATEVKVIG